MFLSSSASAQNTAQNIARNARSGLAFEADALPRAPRRAYGFAVSGGMGGRSRLRAGVMALALGLAAALLPSPFTAGATAQGMFGAVVYVNDSAITNYEIDQRRRFLDFIGAGGGNARERAIERLIEDRLQAQEARRLGLRINPEQISAGMSEFAARAQITTDEMIARMSREGIERETFVEFIRSGVMWRALVRGRFGSEVVISDASLRQAMSIENVRPVTEVLISELFLPSDPQFAEPVRELIPRIQAITTVEEFGNAARQVSAAPSGAQGGRVENWIPLANIPDPVGSALASSGIGRVIGPVELPGAYGFFMLRARRDNREVPPGQTELQYRQAALPGGRSETNLARVAQLRAEVQTCADFGAAIGRVAPELAPEAVTTTSSLVSETPSAIATELARINAGEITATTVEGGALVVRMLCARSLVPEQRPSEDQVRSMLENRELENRARVYLEQLRAEAEIRRN